MLQRALKQTSDQITDHLTKEIWELGQRTSDLKQWGDDLKALLGNNSDELEALREENLTLQLQPEDYENRARRSNLRIQGTPKSVVDLQSAVTV